MVLIDTNIVLRFLLQDHETLSQKAKDIIDNHRAICLNAVTYEAIHVLQSMYKIDRVLIADKLSILFEKSIIESENTQVTIKALTIFKETSLDFMDCLLLAYHIIDNDTIYSFDKKVNNYLKRVNGEI
ncbi:Predicted nucleic acid-binding protein, contains PIN domain [Moraxella caprae]|uniref:Predicted nucleic acid-binding protein, contains PIN domain n=1 Tax=Moraxella caprae TaxID=90240 RepID=A0A378R3S8_9GAMM|nr:PIN domain-containing protein [Moraxella caprae]STZ09251.1 Predicted nucleic acid-binding protein, contains PIN domain [Moraxella caprae]